MSKALRCNKCGRCFDPMIDVDETSYVIRFRNPAILYPEDFRKETVSGRMFEFTANEYVDLCPICSKKFETFMDSKY